MLEFWVSVFQILVSQSSASIQSKNLPKKFKFKGLLSGLVYQKVWE